MRRLLRVAEVARELGCSERFLREAEKNGKLPKARRDLKDVVSVRANILGMKINKPDLVLQVWPLLYHIGLNLRRKAG